MSLAMKELPTRMCVVVPMEDGTYQPYCIACHWQPRKTLRSKTAAEAKARQHCCPRSKE